MISASEIYSACARLFAPPPKLTISQWADEYRYLSAESSAEYGKWHTDRVEYAREIMDAVSDPAVEVVVIKASSQVAKTEILNNVVGYHIHQDPAPILFVFPTLEIGEAWSKDRLSPMLRDSPCFNGLINEARSRKSNNTLLHKSFPGGHITIAGANSPASLSSRPIRIVICDEVNRFPKSAGPEGSPVKLAYKRTTTFVWNRKLVMASTPTIEGESAISEAYELSDKCLLYVPCPDCGQPQVLIWENLKWINDDPSTAVYTCRHCGSCWDDVKKNRAVKRARFRPSAEFKGTRGFFVWEIHSPWVPMSRIVKEWLEVKDSPNQRKTFINTVRGEDYQEQGEALDWEPLYNRRESYPLRHVLYGGLIITAGVDVQKDRIEVYVYAWGRGKENWLIDFIVIEGNPDTDAPWMQLDDVLERHYTSDYGQSMSISRLAIDSNFSTHNVYAWARTKRGSGRVMVLRGVDRGAALLGGSKMLDINHKGKKIPKGIKIWYCCGSYAKSELRAWLQLVPADNKFPPGYCHHPDVGREYFEQLTAETLQPVKDKHGYTSLKWFNPSGKRNEALDCWVYARAAATALGLDHQRVWKSLEFRLGITGEPRPAPPLQEPAPKPDLKPVEQPAPPPQRQAPRRFRTGRVIRSNWARR